MHVEVFKHKHLGVRAEKLSPEALNVTNLELLIDVEVKVLLTKPKCTSVNNKCINYDFALHGVC